MENNWTIKKEISVGDIIAFIAAFIAVITAYTTLDKRITVTEIAVQQQTKIDAEQDAQRMAIKKEVVEAISKVGDKLDWLIQSRLYSQEVQESIRRKK